MLRYTRLIQIISGLCLILIYGLGRSIADDVPLPSDLLRHPEVLGYSRTQILVLNFLVTVVIEYWVICAFFEWSQKAMLKLMLWVPIVNLITNPIAQIGVVFFGGMLKRSEPLDCTIMLQWAIIFVIELAVVAVEFCLFKWIFLNMYRQGVISEPVPVKRTILIAATANTASFAFGFVGIIIWLMEMAPT